MSFTNVLTALAATGGIGDFRPLASLEELAEKHGRPSDSGRGSSEHEWPYWLRYGDVRLEACECRIVHSLQLETWNDTVTIPADRFGEYVALEASTTFRHLESGLLVAGVSWTTITRRPDQFTLEVEAPHATVHFTFVTGGDDEESGKDDALLYGVTAQEFTHWCGQS
ncbi:hypothetical protein OG735_29485 [Streptomyces sp. NBC_01210]|uniref:hypothetical protein n=1 Tax=Streptomyces sp. NBC_01210 TaxID=2903774 RepID=UPI002E0E69F5|nr:hypothetical protein OG735_29485 [Streptomyces sp. NBC_01210]